MSRRHNIGTLNGTAIALGRRDCIAVTQSPR